MKLNKLNAFHYGLFAVLLVVLLGVSNFDLRSLTGYQIVLSEDPCVNAERLREEYYSLIENVNERLNRGEPVDLNEAERFEGQLIEQITSALKKCRNINENIAYALEVSNFLDLDEEAQQPKFIQQESIVGECPIIVVDSCGNGVLEDNEECDPPGYYIPSDKYLRENARERDVRGYVNAVTCTEECKLEFWNYYYYPKTVEEEKTTEQTELDLQRRGLNKLKHTPQFYMPRRSQSKYDPEELRKERQSRPATGGNIGTKG
ncbi:hypothetical protein HZA97_04415 [Candidatus Woesearchaeota archaeon]|nr:hypothetical protein [Candidatus Woesearchaeota archaeon]